MSFNRRERILEHQKQPRVTESVGIPNENEGEEGEQRYVRLSNSLFLYVKSGNRVVLVPLTVNTNAVLSFL